MVKSVGAGTVSLALLVVLGPADRAAAAIQLYESMSSTIGPTANVSGGFLSATAARGFRFHVSENATTGRIGGFMTQFSPGGVYGAVVRLSGPTDVPDSTDLSSADVLGGVVINAPLFPGSGPAIVSSDLNVNLTQGDYAIVFGSGAFGATGTGSISFPGSMPGLHGFTTSSGSWVETDHVFGYVFLTAAEVSSSIEIAPGDPGLLNVLQAVPAGGGLAVDLPLTTGGSFSSNFRQLTPEDVLASGDAFLQNTTFAITGPTFQIWEIEFGGQLLGPASLVFNYDESQLGNDLDESNLGIFHWVGDHWVQETGIFDTANNTITVNGVTSFSPWALGATTTVTPEPSSLTIAGGMALIALCSRIRRRENSRSNR